MKLLQSMCCLAVLFLGASTSIVQAQYGTGGEEWISYGGDRGGTRYSPLSQINRDNVAQLEVAWTWKADNFPETDYRNISTPLMVDGVMYFTAGNRRNVIAVDADTGYTRWTWRMDEGERWEQAPRRNSGRGVSWWSDGQDSRIFVITPGFQLVALDAKTGQPVSDFGIDGVVDLFTQLDLDYDHPPLIGAIGNSSPPTIIGDSVVIGPALRPGGRANIGNVKADIMAINARTGERNWVFHTIPRQGEPGYETWLDGSAERVGNAGIWGLSAGDPELGIVYLPIEAATNDVYGGHRPGNNLYSSSLVALDAASGQMLWYQQLVHHDIWDYDMPPHPILLDLNVDGEEIKAVIQFTKQAFAYAFNRETGEPVWPMEERPVPESDVPGEWTSPTQPFPTKPPPFDVQGVGFDDLIDFTPALRQAAIEAVSQHRIGPIYTPPSLSNAEDGSRGMIVVPGFGGGANWEGGAADPETNYVYIGSNTAPSVVGLEPPGFGTTNALYNMGGSLPLPNLDGLPIMKPPYGRITAYDMNQGEIAWQIPLGDTPEEIANHPLLEGVEIAPTGINSRAGLLVTSTLLIAGEGGDGRPLFHAYDKATGDEIARIEIPVGPQHGSPMTYMVNGKQYIAFFTANAGERIAAQLVAYALPDSDAE